jgi:hypothetical protein
MELFAMNEDWRDVVGYEGLYQVSDLGRVRSLRFGKVKLLTRLYDKDGYWRIGLWNGQRQINYKVHRLVALAFMPEKQNALHREVAHMDGDRENARLDNLKWVSKIENMLHKLKHGTLQVGERHPGAKLSEQDVREIINKLAAGKSQTSLAAIYGVTWHAIADIRSGKNWRHVPRPAVLGQPLSQNGHLNHNAKFSPSDVADIRRRRAAGETCKDLAEAYGVWKGTISRVARGDAYRGIALTR